jgi:hydroxylysine kinase
MTDHGLGGLLGSAPPLMAPEELAALLARHYGLAGPMRALTSERDLNLHLATPAQGYVVKLANAAEPAEVTDFQTRALVHLETAGLPVPRILRSLDGATEVATPQGVLRVLTYLEGIPQHLTPKTPAQSASMAAMAARIALGLQGFQHPAARHVLQWDLKQAASLRPLLPAISDPALRDLAEASLARFEAEVAPALPDLRWQVVHNDLNPHNVLTAVEDPDRIAGVLDFGDMVETPLVCDAAIAAAYQLDPSDAQASLLGFARAYHAVLPLTRAELRLLPDLAATRMLTTIAITSTRAARYPDNAPYILRNFPAAREGLIALAALDRTVLLTALESL